MKMLILLHGWGGKKQYWSQLESQLKGTAKTLALDLPGFGDEKLVEDDWGVPEYANWVIELIKREKYEDVILVGHSFGGRVAAEIAANHPKWLSGLILDASPCLYRPSNSTLLKIRVYKLLKNMLPQPLKTLFYPSDLKDANERKLGKVFRTVVNYDQTQQLKAIQVPTLMIWGENDTEVPLRIAIEMRELISNSSLEIFENSGHFPLLDKASKYVDIVRTFINTK